jgi:ABC-type transporter Mla MlaB component
MTAKKKTKEVLLKADKELTYSVAEKLCSQLTSALGKSAMVRLDLTDIVSVDLSSIQMIISARRSFDKKSIPFQINFTCSNEVGKLLENCGFRKFPDCEPVS